MMTIIIVISQPSAFKYQSVVRDASGEIMANQLFRICNPKANKQAFVIPILKRKCRITWITNPKISSSGFKIPNSFTMYILEAETKNSKYRSKLMID